LQRKIFGCEEKKVRRSWRKLSSSVSRFILLSVLCSGDEIKQDEMGGPYGTNGGEETFVEGLVRKPEGNIQLGRAKREWKKILK
jgi:hypothetical protein